jgi:hypothetical protein
MMTHEDRLHAASFDTRSTSIILTGNTHNCIHRHLTTDTMESPTEEPETIIPMETISSGSPTMLRPTEDSEAIIPMETASMSNDSETVSNDSATTKDEDADPIPPETVSNAANMTASNSPNMNPAEVDEAPIPPEIVSNDSATTTTTVRLRRRAANRTEPLYLRRGTRPRQLPEYFTSLPPPQDEDNPAARKKPRLEESLPTARAKTRDEVARKTNSHDVSQGHSPSADDDDDDDDDDANTDAESVTDKQANAVATGSWTLEEDSNLTSAVTNTSKKKCGKEYKTDWVAVASLVLGRTNRQCSSRWRDFLDPSIDRTPPGRTGTWAEDEDMKLKDAVQMHGGKNWDAIAARVLGRTIGQCWSRWRNALHPSIDRANRRTGTWAEDEDSKLKDAVQTHGGKDWTAIAALVPGRTRKQCHHRWKEFLDPSIGQASGRTGKWTAVEDSTLKDAVQTHGGKNWGAIAALVPGRTTNQCRSRWKSVLDPSINRTPPGRTGKWTVDEDSKLEDAVQRHGGKFKDWVAISALVPGRTKNQCCCRWHDAFNPSIDLANGRTGKWAEEEDNNLKDAVQTHGDKDWSAISVLVPGRTKKQCSNRWHNAQRPTQG